MQDNQKFSPKYWVVHDKTTDDVFLHSASKSAYEAKVSFASDNQVLYTYFGYTTEDKSFCGFNMLADLEEHEDLEVVLVSINKVRGMRC